MKKTTLIFLLGLFVSLNSFAQVAVSDDTQTFIEAQRIIQSIKERNPVVLNPLISIIESNPQKIRDRIFVLNWVMNIHGLYCDSNFAKSIIPAINDISSLKNQYGVQIACDDHQFSQKDNLRLPLQVKLNK